MNIAPVLVSCLLLVMAPHSAFADEPVSIEQFAWLSGHWIGDGFGGVSEEMWTAPKGGAMLGVYRHLADGRNNFYEFLQIDEHDGTVRLRLKHFNPDMSGWEDKADFVEFPLDSVSLDKAAFKGLVYERTSPNTMTVTLTLHDKDGSRQEVFSFKRQTAGE